MEMGRLTPIALVTTFLPMVGSAGLLIFGYPIGIWLRENPFTGAVSFTVGVLLICGLALMPTNLIGILGGFAFGFELGLALIMIAIVGAAFLSFLIHRRVIGDAVPEFTGRHPKADAIYRALTGQGLVRTVVIILLIRFSILMPFAFTNFLLASAKVPAPVFAFATFLGMLPRSGAVVLTGAGLSQLTFDKAPDLWFIVFGTAATIASIVVIAVISRRALDRMTAV